MLLISITVRNAIQSGDFVRSSLCLSFFAPNRLVNIICIHLSLTTICYPSTEYIILYEPIVLKQSHTLLFRTTKNMMDESICVSCALYYL